MRLAPWLASSLAVLALAFAPLTARADDPPAGPKPDPAAEAAKKKEEFGDIQTDWKKAVKPKRDAQLAKERAQYWESKGVSGLGLFWLGWMWDMARDYGKSAAAFEGYLKVPEAKEQNRERAMIQIMVSYGKAEQWEKAVAAGEMALKTYPMSNNVGGTADELGRIYRRWDKNDKAMEYFTHSAEAKSSNGLFDLVDMHLTAGEPDKARAALAKYGEGLKAASKTAVTEMNAFLDVLGKPAPALEGVKSPTGSDVPPKFGNGKWTFVFLTYLSMAGLEVNLTTVSKIANLWDNVDSYAVMTYAHWDPFQRKVIQELTPEQEFEMQGKVLAKESGGAKVLTIASPLWESLRLKAPGQKMLIDPQGNFRWLRISHTSEYDWFCLRKALDKFTGSTGSGGAAEAPVDPGGGEPGGEMPGGG